MIAERQSPTHRRRSAGAGAPARRWVWWLVGAGLLAVSGVIVAVAHTRPGYDPYGWLIWGYQTVHGTLNLGGAPSWKPLPWLFTIPFSLFGRYAELYLWMTLAEAASFAGCIFAGRIAFRVVDDGGRHRRAAIAAAIFAGVALLLIFDTEHYSYLHYVLSVQSDPPIVSLCLAAIDFYLSRRHRWAIAMLTLASLGRPETWPFLLLYCVWCWFELPGMRTYIAFCLLLVPALWFGVPTITNGKPLIAASLAENSPREIHSNRVLATIGRFRALNLWTVWVLAGLAPLWCYVRHYRPARVAARAARPPASAPAPHSAPGAISSRGRQLDGAAHTGQLAGAAHTGQLAGAAHTGVVPTRPSRRTAALGEPVGGLAHRITVAGIRLATWARQVPLVLWLFACVLLWMAIEVAFSLHGFPAVPRYMFEPAAVSIVLGAIGFGWLLGEIPSALRLPPWLGVLAACALVAWAAPGAITRARNEHADLIFERARTAELGRLASMVKVLGGTRQIYACGEPVLDVEFVSALGWLIHRNTDQIGYRPALALSQPRPIVLLTPLPNGWAAYAWHIRPAMRAFCDKRMRILYVSTPRHPGGVVLPNRVPPQVPS
jgi:hypothetical protein